MFSSSEQILKINQLSMRYPRNLNWTLKDLTIGISAKERLALVGPSGCGKSTLTKVILNMQPKGSICTGEVLLNGKNPKKLSPSHLRQLRGEAVGLVFQDPMTRLNPLITIGQHLVDTLNSHNPKASCNYHRKRARELLEKVGIGANRFKAYPHEVSGGMRQRLAIAMAICLNPPLIIADEPTTSLDVAVADQVMGELANLCEELGSALLLISHDLALAARWCNRMAILDMGRIVEEGTSCELLTKPQSTIGKRLLECARKREGENTPFLLHSEVVLEVENLRCWHSIGGYPWSPQWLKALDEINFCLHAGETLGIVGASGCGKSTLCRALMGLTSVKGGQVKIGGENVLQLQGHSLKKARKTMQMVFQDPLACLNPKMNILEAIADPLLIHGLTTKAQAKEHARSLLQEVGLTPPENYQYRLPSELSGGQQQRIAIARAIALKPKVLICDESVSMLDAEIQAEILTLLQKLQKHFRLSIIFVTHDLSVAIGFCHRVIVLDNGSIVEEGPGKELLLSPKTSITERMMKACPRLPKSKS